MLDSMHVKKGSTLRLIAGFVDTSGAQKTGLTVAVRVLRKSDDKYLKNDGTWVSSPASEPTATEWDSSNMPGVYYYDWALPSGLDEYIVRFDGSGDAATRYQFAYVRAVRVDEADLHKIKAALVNKQVQTISTGVVTIKDDDGTTDLVTLTPGVDDVESPTENVLTPS